MDTSQDIYEELERLWIKFQKNHERFKQNNVKKCGVTARKTMNEIRKLSSTYRMANLEESKQL